MVKKIDRNKLESIKVRQLLELKKNLEAVPAAAISLKQRPRKIGLGLDMKESIVMSEIKAEHIDSVRNSTQRNRSKENKSHLLYIHPARAQSNLQ